MRNQNQPSTDIDSMGRLALAAALAAEHLFNNGSSEVASGLLDAADALEEEFDSLKEANTVLRVEKSALMKATSFHPGLLKYCRELENEIIALRGADENDVDHMLSDSIDALFGGE